MTRAEWKYAWAAARLQFKLDRSPCYKQRHLPQFRSILARNEWQCPRRTPAAAKNLWTSMAMNPNWRKSSHDRREFRDDMSYQMKRNMARDGAGATHANDTRFSMRRR